MAPSTDTLDWAWEPGGEVLAVTVLDCHWRPRDTRNIKQQRFFEVAAPLRFGSSVAVGVREEAVAQCIVPGSSAGCSGTAVRST